MDMIRTYVSFARDVPIGENEEQPFALAGLDLS